MKCRYCGNKENLVEWKVAKEIYIVCESCMNKMKNIELEPSTITFTVKGNYTDEKHNFYSTDVLFKAYQNYIGKEIECEDFGNRIVTDVSIQGEFIFIETNAKT